jgi:phytoene synthase
MKDQAAANQSLQTGSRTFFFASLLMSKSVAQKAARLYMFCRYVDDLVDMSTDPSATGESVNALIRALEHDEPYDDATADVIDLFKRCDIPRWIPIELLKGVQSDLEPVEVNTEQELLHYCFRVAGTVGLMMCHIMNVADKEARRHAVDLGIAMQLTNIMRDISEDALLGRRYLPIGWAPRISRDELVLPPDVQSEKRIGEAMARLYALSETYYSSGFLGLPYIPLGSRYAIMVAGQTYRRIGRLIRERNFNYWSQRTVVSLVSKIWIAAQWLVWAHLSPRFWTPPHGHEKRLHTPIDIYPISPVDDQLI